MDEFYVSKTSNLAEFITELTKCGYKKFWIEDLGDKWFVSHAEAGNLAQVKNACIVLDHPELEVNMSEAKVNLSQMELDALKALSEGISKLVTVEKEINKETITKESEATRAMLESQNARIKKIEELLSGDMSKLEKIKAALNAMNAALGKLD